MSRLSVKIEYDKKVSELREMVDQEAKRLQDVVDKKEGINLEIKILSDKKTILTRGIAGLEQEIKEKQEALNQLVNRESSFVSSVKTELSKEKDDLKQTKDSLGNLTDKLNETKIVASEIDTFIKKEADARVKYLDQEEKLKLSQREFKEIESKTELDMKELVKRTKELDTYKQYISDLYGKLASYVKVANETVESVNSYLKEKNIPMEFGLPPGEIVKIYFNNFNIRKTDS